ncbi:unnamed protein product, partial [Ectocarpus sp. 4 AP-2014]
MPHHRSSAVGRHAAVNSNISRGDWVNKLNDARREWMVMLHRYQNSSSSGNDSDAPLVGKLRQDHVQTAGREAPHKRNSTGTSHGRMVPAADFCLHCASIVKVELECTSEGEVIAERRRTCSVCETAMREELTPNWRSKHQCSFQRGTNHMHFSRGSSTAWQTASERMTSKQGADFLLDSATESGVHGYDGRPNNKLDSEEDTRSARRERMLRGLTPWTPRPTPKSASPTRSVGKPESAVGIDPASHGVASSNSSGDPVAGDVPASGGDPAVRQASTHGPESAPGGIPTNPESAAGGVSVNPKNASSVEVSMNLESASGGVSSSNAPVPADGEWAEQIRVKDELISTLRRQLTALGEQPIEEVVTLEEAKKRLREAIDALMAGDASVEMELALEKWDKYVTNHPDHIKEQAAEEQAWEAANEPKNNEALHLMKTFVPPDIFHAGLDGLREGGLTPALAKRIFDRKVLWLIRAPFGMVSKTHVVELKSKYLANDLDVVESRALHACLPLTFENDADGAKTAWRAGFCKRLKALLDKEAAGQLKPAELRRPVYKGIEKGPFDPDAAAEEQETMRSSAFDASEKPVVGGKLKASAIAVIGDGLGAKLKTGPAPLDIIGYTKDASADVDGMTRSTPNSPASKYRRQSYALSRGQPTTCSMKNMMSELGNRISHRRQSQRRRSSFNGVHDVSQLIRGAFDGRIAENGGLRPSVDEASSQGSDDDAAIEPTIDPAPLPSTQPSQAGMAVPPPDPKSSVDTKKTSPNPGAKTAPPSMKDMMAELAAKAKAREERSASPLEDGNAGAGNNVGADSPIVPRPIPQPPATPPPDPKSSVDIKKTSPNPGAKTAPPSMKDMMTELAAEAKAREERSASPLEDGNAGAGNNAGMDSPIVPPSIPQPPATPLPDPKSSVDTKKTSPNPGGKTAPPSMKDMMAELAAKAKAREERSA